MLSSGFTNAPVSKYLVIYIIASAIALSIFDAKHLAQIQVNPHLWRYGQLSRILRWQVAGYANSTETLFAAMLAYHMRVVERLWGSRKMAVSVDFFFSSREKEKKRRELRGLIWKAFRHFCYRPYHIPPSSPLYYWLSSFDRCHSTR